MSKKTKQNSIRKKETEEFISLVTETFDLMFDGSVDFRLNKPLQIIIFECFIGKVISDEKEQKYRLLLLRAISNLLEGAIKNINTFKPEHVITKNRSIN